MNIYTIMLDAAGHTMSCIVVWRGRDRGWWVGSLDKEVAVSCLKKNKGSTSTSQQIPTEITVGHQEVQLLVRRGAGCGGARVRSLSTLDLCESERIKKCMYECGSEDSRLEAR